MDIFVSVGTGLSPQQEAFVNAIEARLKITGLTPCTIGRNTFSSDAPFKAICTLMDRCAGAVVLALERFSFPEGTERRGSAKEQHLSDVAFPTSWNQIEAAMAHSRGLPLLVIVDENLRCDGLLEKGNDWFVFSVPVDPDALESLAFAGLLESWRARVAEQAGQKNVPPPARSSNDTDLAKMNMAQILGTLKPAQFWATLVAVIGALAGAFALGAKFGP